VFQIKFISENSGMEFCIPKLYKTSNVFFSELGYTWTPELYLLPITLDRNLIEQ